MTNRTRARETTSDREPPQMVADASWRCTAVPCRLGRKVVRGDVVVQMPGRWAYVHGECAS